MNRQLFITITLIGILTLMPVGVFSYEYAFDEITLDINEPHDTDNTIRDTKAKIDSMVLTRLFDHKRNYIGMPSDSVRTIYLKNNINTTKRNPTLMLVPSMYSISKGNRDYVGETFGKMRFNGYNDYDIEQQLTISTVPHSRKILPHLIYYIIPNLYGECLFNDKILSPFNRANNKFYKYFVTMSNFGRAIIHFKPRLYNTQLVWGYALVNTMTGRIIKADIHGEFDMITFSVKVDMGGNDNADSVFPISSDIRSWFSFLGNDITCRISTNFDVDVSLPDSIGDVAETMAKLRPEPLNAKEEQVYSRHFVNKNQSAVKAKRSKVTDVAWDIIGDYLIGSVDVKSSRTSINMSPLVNPLYLSYSRRRGLSYKMKLGAQYKFNDNSQIMLRPQIGYNFKVKRFFYSAPLRYTYDRKNEGWIELRIENGNIITNSDVLNKIKGEKRDTVDFSSLNLDYFDNRTLSLFANRRWSNIIGLKVGANYHVRTALNKEAMRQARKPTSYRSFAPSATLTISPFRQGPVLTANYERSIRSIMHSNTEYERIEIDGVFNKKLQRLRQYNLRLGGGFYTNKSSQYFVDFANFHEDYLPGGWADDWSGDFQLLNSEWYNASNYYVRAHASYESPMMVLSRLPLVGRYIETERFYDSVLEIEKTRPYSELGYGFTTRFFSVGFFTSFLNFEFHEFGTKFTFELFRKW